MELSHRLLTAPTFEGRLAALTDALAGYGVGAINAAELAQGATVPLWFHSTLGADVRAAYIADGHWRNDVITAAAQGERPTFVWDARHGMGPAATAAATAFERFMRDTGAATTISAFMRAGPMGDRRALTAVVSADDDRALDPRQAEEIVLLLRLAIPWIDGGDAAAAGTRLRFSAVTLTPRERQSLQLLAGGLRVARIAEAMGVSEAMVSKHLASARQKLSAQTREQAVAEAIRLRQIVP